MQHSMHQSAKFALHPRLRSLPRLKWLLMVCVASAGFPALAVAHHSPARFLEDQVVAIHGQVVELDWSNPHVYLALEDADGARWLFEGNATSNLRRLGWTRDSLQVGDTVTVRAHPDRDTRKNHGRMLSVSGPGERLLQVMTGGQKAPSEPRPVTRSLNGIWRGDGELAFKFLFAIIDHPLKERGAVSKIAYDESMDPIAECITWPTPRIVAWSAFYLAEIEVREDVVLMRNEFNRLERVVYMDGRDHPADGARSSQGHSIGHWDGDTLVVDTRLFSRNRSPYAAGIPSGENKHVVERYTLRPDGSAIDIDILLQDPDYLAKPFTAQLVWNYSPELEFIPFDCDPQSASRFAE